MYIRFMLISFFILTILIVSAQADEPTWLFTVPKAESLPEDHYNLGLLFLDFGLTDNLEFGIHGLKYAIPDSNIALGAGFWPMGSPYVVSSWDLGSADLHIGFKARMYILFAGIEIPLSDKLKLFAEFSDGTTVGIRIFPAQRWTLDILFAYMTVETYRYKYERVRREDFNPFPGIQVVYSGRLQ